MGTLGTTTLATATASGNQRHEDRTQNGVLWSVEDAGTAGGFSTAYSTDNGTTWTVNANAIAFANGTGSTYSTSVSLFIDLDDYAHVVYRDKYVGQLHYRRGTPNAARTAYTWSNAVVVQASSEPDVPDAVVHREGTGWRVHVVWSLLNSGSYVVYKMLTVAADGSVTVQASGTTINAAAGSPSYLPYASIDFRHTGDAKTVAGSTPDLFVGWSQGSAGSGQGVRFRKATYSGGSWAWGTERQIDGSHYVDGNAATWLQCAFDGTRFVLAGHVQPGLDVIAHDRDAADTTTTTRVLSTDSTGANYLGYGSLGFNTSGDVFVFGSSTSEAAGSRQLGYRRWVRSTNTFEARVVLDSTANGSPYLSARRGTQGNALDYVYTDGTTSPYTISSGRVQLNQPPGAPSLVAPVGAAKVDRTSATTLSWTRNDPDPGDSQSAYRVRYKLASAGAWATTTALTQSTATQHVLAAGALAAGDYEWQAESTDAAGATSPWSASGFFTAADPPAAPTITAPAAGATVPAETDLKWSSPTQDAYEFRRVADNAGTPVPGTQYESTGTLVSTDRQRRVVFTVNNRTEHLQVRVRYQGLWSSWASVRVVISFTPPAAPGVVVTAIPHADPNTVGATDALRVVITDPTPTGSQPTVTSHDVEVSHDAGTTWHRVATGLPAGTWVWPWPISGVNYLTRVTAFGPSSTSASTTVS